MLNGGSMIWGFCVYFVYMIPLETDVLRKHRFQKQYFKDPITVENKIRVGVACFYVRIHCMEKCPTSFPNDVLSESREE